MELKILKQRETPLISRKRMTAEITFDKATPSRGDIVKEIAKKEKVSENLVVVKHIYQRFGQLKAKAICHIYFNKEDLERIEPEYLKKKHGKKEKKAEEKAEEKPAEKAEAKEEKAAEKVEEKK